MLLALEYSLSYLLLDFFLAKWLLRMCDWLVDALFTNYSIILRLRSISVPASLQSSLILFLEVGSVKSCVSLVSMLLISLISF